MRRQSTEQQAKSHALLGQRDALVAAHSGQEKEGKTDMNCANLIIHRIARLMGVDYLRYNAVNFASVRRAHFLQTIGVGLVVDVGAHSGAYGNEIRACGYRGEIVSFEPVSEAYKRLHEAAAKDRNWETKCLGLGATGGDMLINISGRPTSSSLLQMKPAHEDASPKSRYIGTERVKIERLEKLLDVARAKRAPGWLKIDVQGYEMHVLEGAGPLLPEFQAIELELSLTPVYQGAPLIEDVMVYLRQRGFRPTSLENVLVNPKSGHVLQVNGIFLREHHANCA